MPTSDVTTVIIRYIRGGWNKLNTWSHSWPSCLKSYAIIAWSNTNSELCHNQNKTCSVCVSFKPTQISQVIESIIYAYSFYIVNIMVDNDLMMQLLTCQVWHKPDSAWLSKYSEVEIIKHGMYIFVKVHMISIKNIKHWLPIFYWFFLDLFVFTYTTQVCKSFVL